MFQWLRDWVKELREPFDVGWDDNYPDSSPPIPSDFGADTQPIADKGALDSDPGRLK